MSVEGVALLDRGPLPTHRFYLGLDANSRDDFLHHAVTPLAGLDDPASLRLLLAQGKGELNKVRRRDLVTEKYRILALVGDQLGDFSDEFAPKGENLEVRKAVDIRRDAVYAARGKFGVEWFVLPQPVYGSWQRLLKGDATQYLRRAHN